MDVRLKTMLSMMPPHDTLYDIGTDHAYLPIAAVQTKTVKKAYAVDNKKGPLTQAEKSIAQAGLKGTVIPTLASGIDALNEDCDLITISGLGGNAIYDILKNGLFPNVKTMILQANNHTELLRKLTTIIPFKITDEQVVVQKGETYIIIKLEIGREVLDETDLYIGPILRKNPPDPYKASLEAEHLFLEHLIQTIPDEKAKAPLMKKRNLLEAIFNEWRNH